jgi:hypothetical protein
MALCGLIATKWNPLTQSAPSPWCRRHGGYRVWGGGSERRRRNAATEIEAETGMGVMASMTVLSEGLLTLMAF